MIQAPSDMNLNLEAKTPDDTFMIKSGSDSNEEGKLVVSMHNLYQGVSPKLKMSVFRRLHEGQYESLLKGLLCLPHLRMPAS